MIPKPAHLGLKYAEQFQDTSIVGVYHHRPPYPAETFRILTGLITDSPRNVLEVGCGTGDLARGLATEVERVDAVDFSAAMLARGKTLPGGDAPQLNWLYGRVEDIELHPPYSLIIAGDSLHWMQWDIVLPLFHRLLTPNGYLAIVTRGTEQKPLWSDNLLPIIQRYATNQEYQPYDLIEELELRHLFQPLGTTHTQPVPFLQSGENYLRSIHSQNGFSYERMGEASANAFDEEVRNLIAPFLHNGQLTLSIVGTVIWGKPQTL